MRLATEDELARWDDLVVANPDGGNALQTKAWGEFKSRWGWQPRRYIYQIGDREVAVQWLVRHERIQGDIWYCPKGPGVMSQRDLISLVKQSSESKPRGIFMRFEAEVLEDDIAVHELVGAGLVRANRDPGSKSTIFVDLTGSPEAVLARFNQSARRNIRKAEAGSVVVEPVAASDQNLETMFELMKATEARAHYGLRPAAYFRDYWTTQIRAGQAQLFFARHESDVLAGIFVTYLGRRAWYKDGGSFDLKRELQAAYILQWQVMKWLMERGITQYDLVGSPNRDQIGTGDPRAGLYEFKRKFNPEITEFAGCWDLPLNKAAYQRWLKVGERVASRMANRRPEKFLY